MDQSPEDRRAAAKEEKRELREQRLNDFLNEPAREGNALAELQSGTSDAQANTEAMEDRMREKIADIMEPFSN